jgi:hypothetical protein
VRSGPGAARTILLFHIISVRPSKQPLMVCTFLKVYMELGSYFLFLQEQIKDIIIFSPRNTDLEYVACTGPVAQWQSIRLRFKSPGNMPSVSEQNPAWDLLVFSQAAICSWIRHLLPRRTGCN